jgi:hypothetical protein
MEGAGFIEAGADPQWNGGEGQLPLLDFEKQYFSIICLPLKIFFVPLN